MPRVMDCASGGAAAVVKRDYTLGWIRSTLLGVCRTFFMVYLRSAHSRLSSLSLSPPQASPESGEKLTPKHRKRMLGTYRDKGERRTQEHKKKAAYLENGAPPVSAGAAHASAPARSLVRAAGRGAAR